MLGYGIRGEQKSLLPSPPHSQHQDSQSIVQSESLNIRGLENGEEDVQFCLRWGRKRLCREN